MKLISRYALHSDLHFGTSCIYIAASSVELCSFSCFAFTHYACTQSNQLQCDVTSFVLLLCVFSLSLSLALSLSAPQSIPFILFLDLSAYALLPTSVVCCVDSVIQPVIACTFLVVRPLTNPHSQTRKCTRSSLYMHVSPRS
jgi:hypothetical protein